jgi:hypothetical protein
LPGEFAQEALWSYYARDYLMQVSAAATINISPIAAAMKSRCAVRSAGLKSMLADPHLEVFNLLVRLKRVEACAARKIAAEHDYRSAKAALKDLDKRFAALEAQEPLTRATRRG